MNLKKLKAQQGIICIFTIVFFFALFSLKVDASNLFTSVSTPSAFALGAQFATPDNSTSLPHPSLVAFPIPEFNSQIGLYSNVNYKTAKFENNTWFFADLKSTSQSDTNIQGNLYISAKNCSVIIGVPHGQSSNLIYSSVEFNWLDYSVVGAGTQTFYSNALFSDSARWVNWTVRINGEVKQMGDCWNYSYASKELTIATTEENSMVNIRVYEIPDYSSIAPLPPAEPGLANFTAFDHFQIPAGNGTFNFAIDGSFDKASLDSKTWNFVNLTLNNYAINAGDFATNVTGRDVLPYILQANYPANLGISVENCNITITGISPVTWHSTPEINYTIQGTGSQIFNFPFLLTSYNWTVYIDGLPKASNDGWLLASNYQLKVTNASSDVAIIGQHIPTICVLKYDPLSYQLILPLVGIVVFLMAVLVLIVIRGHRNRKDNS